MLNNEQLAAGARSIVAALLAFAAGKGWISHDDALQLTPLLGSLALVAYGMYRRRSAALVKTAQQVPGVEVIGVDTSHNTAASPAVVALANSPKPEDANIKPMVTQ